MQIVMLKRQITKDDIGQKALFTYSRGDSDKFEAQRDIRPCIVSINNIRNNSDVKLFHKYWALMKLISDNAHNDEGEQLFKTKEDVSDYIKYKTNLIDYMEAVNWEGQQIIRMKTKSIAWEKMSVDEFQQYWSKFISVACSLLGCTETEINNNLIFYM